MKFLHMFAVLLVAYAISSCGSDDSDSSSPPAPPPVNTEWVVTAAVIERNCGRCHVAGDGKSGWKESGASFLASSAQAKVRGGAMPKPGSPEAAAITQSDKGILLGFGS